MIKAKPVVPDRYWILTDSQGKVGNIQAQSQGYSVRIGTEIRTVQDLQDLVQDLDVDFESSATRVTVDQPENQVHGYPTTSTPYNPVWDVQKQIPLWTPDPRSRSWLAAGWYRLHLHRSWRVVQCPKKIILDRYPFQGPYRSKDEAQNP